MGMSLGSLQSLLVETLTAPDTAAKRLFSLPLLPAEAWQALALSCLLSAMSTQIVVLMAPPEEAAFLAQLIGSPLQLALVLTAGALCVVFAVHWIGHAMGGTGALVGSVLLITWIQFLMLGLQVVQIVFGLILPVLAAAVGLFGLVLIYFLLTRFILVLHGFKSPYKVFGMIVISQIGLLVALLIGVRLLDVFLLGV